MSIIFSEAKENEYKLLNKWLSDKFGFKFTKFKQNEKYFTAKMDNEIIGVSKILIDFQDVYYKYDNFKFLKEFITGKTVYRLGLYIDLEYRHKNIGKQLIDLSFKSIDNEYSVISSFMDTNTLIPYYKEKYNMEYIFTNQITLKKYYKTNNY